MSLEGWYYLHVNGDLIYKKELGETVADIRESDFARMVWPFDPEDRAGAWRILIEALALGDNNVRVMELAKKWSCDDEDARIYADRVGINVSMDGNSLCATRIDFDNLQESPAGFGDTLLEAFAELCKNLGYKPQKTWGTTFEHLLK